MSYITVYRIVFDKTRRSYLSNSDQNCTQDFSRGKGFTARFTKPPAEPFPALHGKFLCVEWKTVHWLSMGAARRNGLRRAFLLAAGNLAAL